MAAIDAHHEISDAEALAERVSCYAASDSLIGGGNGRTEIQEISFSLRSLYTR